MSHVIGIDLGTTNSALAFTESEDAEMMPVAQLVNAGEVREETLLPSFLYVPGPKDVPASSPLMTTSLLTIRVTNPSRTPPNAERIQMFCHLRPGGTLPDPVFFGMPVPLSEGGYWMYDGQVPVTLARVTSHQAERWGGDPADELLQ